MTEKGSQQLIGIRSELKQLILELEDLETQIRSGFRGVGSDRCADSIASVVSRYSSALTTLNAVQASSLDG